MEHPRPTEQEITKVNNWISNLSERGAVTEIDPMLLRSVLAEYGANFEISETGKESLSKFSNLNRRKGMDEVWGNETVKSYRIWLRHWVENFDADPTHRPLPTLVGEDTKTSGGLKFFTDLTVFAAELMTFEEYKKITERRWGKGDSWQKKSEGEDYVPTDYSSFPPKFPSIAWEFIKTSKKK